MYYTGIFCEIKDYDRGRRSRDDGEFRYGIIVILKLPT